MYSVLLKAKHDSKLLFYLHFWRSFTRLLDQLLPSICGQVDARVSLFFALALNGATQRRLRLFKRSQGLACAFQSNTMVF